MSAYFRFWRLGWVVYFMYILWVAGFAVVSWPVLIAVNFLGSYATDKTHTLAIQGAFFLVLLVFGVPWGGWLFRHFTLRNPAEPSPPYPVTWA